MVTTTSGETGELDGMQIRGEADGFKLFIDDVDILSLPYDPATSAW